MGQLPDELVWQANNTLEAAGVYPLIPNGAVFDPTMHQSVGLALTDDQQKVNTIARTISPGYADDRHVFLPARVVVFSANASREGLGP